MFLGVQLPNTELNQTPNQKNDLLNFGYMNPTNNVCIIMET